MIYHYICGLIEDKKLVINWIESSTIFVDSLTKAFFAALFKKY